MVELEEIAPRIWKHDGVKVTGGTFPQESRFFIWRRRRDRPGWTPMHRTFHSLVECAAAIERIKSTENGQAA